jgi:RAT1-interacting protein
LLKQVGYKFEAVALIPDIWDKVSRDYIESRERHVVDNMQQYCSVVQTGIGSTTLLLGGEVDAGKPMNSPSCQVLTCRIDKVWDRKPDDPEQPINWVELKTAEEIQSDHDKVKFERKLLKFWIQSFLLGVPKIIVGFRSKTGMLLRLEEIPTHSIPGNVKRQKNTWDGNTCVNFAATLLECKSSFSCPIDYPAHGRWDGHIHVTE